EVLMGAAAKVMSQNAKAVALPMAPMSRTISLIARRGVLHEMPGQVADRLRPLLTDLIVGPATERMPWLGDGLRVL
ncbi:MAG: LysR family transcriptional regulator, partial [Pseudomonadota bacterium]